MTNEQQAKSTLAGIISGSIYLGWGSNRLLTLGYRLTGTHSGNFAIEKI